MTTYTSGIDVGSTVSKCIMLRDDKEIISKSLVNVGTGTPGPQRAIEEVLKNAGKTREGMDYTLAIGYDRNSLEDIADRRMSKLSCHAKSAFFLFPKIYTVIDIGNRDVKVLKIGDGVMTNFQMNDKCAARTRRFLDVMAWILEVSIEDLEKLLAESAKHVDISSTCMVFVGNGVINQLAQGTDKRDIITGIHRAIAGRAAGLVRRVGFMPDVTMTGGVAQNHDVARALGKQLSYEIETPLSTQYNDAFGAVLFAYRGVLKHAKA